MDSKEEKIKEAYGIHFGKVKNYLDVNGWCSTRKRINFFEIERDLELEAQGYIWRPKSLQGIENNNGWIKIESEDDLPKNDGEYWIITKSKIIVHAYFEVGDVRFSQNGRDYYKGLPTHYQPTQKPSPPIY